MHLLCTSYAPLMHLLCTSYAPAMHLLCTSYAPAMHLLCTSYAPAMHLLCTSYAPAMHLLCTSYAPAMHLLCTSYAPAMHLLCTCTRHSAPSMPALCICAPHSAAPHPAPCTLPIFMFGKPGVCRAPSNASKCLEHTNGVNGVPRLSLGVETLRGVVAGTQPHIVHIVFVYCSHSGMAGLAHSNPPSQGSTCRVF